MNRTLRFCAQDILRLRSDIPTLFFSIVLPVFFYFIFGASQGYADAPLPGGNMAGSVMIAMALYAGVIGAVGAASAAVSDVRSGWGRQLALTPLSNRELLFANLCSIAVRAILPIAAVFIAGACTGASLDGGRWVSAFALTFICVLPFGFYGLLWAQLLRSESAVSLATASVVVLAFAGNLFVPLEGTLLQISRFTPLYGAQMLSRWPVTEGAVFGTDPMNPLVTTDPLWLPLFNLVGWTIVIIGLSAALRGRDNSRP